MSETAAILRHQARDGNVFDKSNDTVVVTRSLLTTAADEIERLRAALRECRNMVGHPDNIAFIDAALADEQYHDNG